ncbi:MAG: bile acid:sodium symporter family protein [Bacteroidetes bacterium]|nr:bile acid:sodium symporter family protein [Bacteroidota bacterium]
MAGIDINILLNVVLGLIMFGLGLSLSPKDFRNLFDQPRALGIGLFSQMVLLPGVAWLVAGWAPVSNELKVGIMILSVCPGGITSNLISYFVKGNVALAISLTVCNAFLSLFTIPTLVNLFLEYFQQSGQNISLPFWQTMFEIFIITILPAGLGVLFNYRLKGIAHKAEKYLNYVLPVLLILVFSFKFLAGSDKGGTGMTAHEIWELAPWMIVLNALSMLLGFVAGTFFKLNFKNRITISVEVGLHNTALALLIAGDKLGNHTMEKPALVYALFSFFITFIVAWIMTRVHKGFVPVKD